MLKEREWGWDRGGMRQIIPSNSVSRVMAIFLLRESFYKRRATPRYELKTIYHPATPVLGERGTNIAADALKPGKSAARSSPSSS